MYEDKYHFLRLALSESLKTTVSSWKSHSDIDFGVSIILIIITIIIEVNIGSSVLKLRKSSQCIII